MNTIYGFKYIFRTLALVCVLSSPCCPAQAQLHSEKNDSIMSVLSYVYTENPTLQAARSEFEAIREALPQAQAGWLPTISAETGVFTSDVESSNFGAGDGATTKDVTVSVDQPIFRGGRTFAEVGRACDVIKSGYAQLKYQEQEIFRTTVRAYASVVRDQELLALKEMNADSLREELRAAQEQLDLGFLTTTDVDQAHTRVTRAEADLMQAQTNLANSLLAFTEITGLDYDVILKPTVLQFDFPSSVKEAQAIALSYNPQMWIAQAEGNAADHSIDVVRRELYPQISAYASTNKQYDPQPGIVKDTQTSILGLKATLTLYQGGATRSRIREAQKTKQQLDYQMRETERSVLKSVSSAWQDYETAKVLLEKRQVEIRAAQRALEGVRTEAQLGQRTVLDILNADRELLDAKEAQAKARYNEITARIALAESMGILNADTFGFTTPANANPS